jgi:LysR family hydrogen peroxide-inducible transcriptional activator
VLYESGSIETLKQLVRNGSGMTLVPELSVEPGDPHVRRFVAPEPVRQVSLVVRRPFVRRKLLEEMARCIRKALPINGTAKRRVVQLS